MKLVSLAEVKTFLQKTDSDDDALLTLVIEMVSSQIETFLNRKLKEESREQKFSGGRKVYFLPAYPVNVSPVPAIEIDGTAQDENDDFFVDYEAGIIEFTFKVSNVEPKILQITWTGGYTETAGVLVVPDSIKMAALTQSVHTFMRRDTMGVASMGMPDGSTAYSGAIDLLPIVKDLIKALRKSACDA